MVVAVVAAQVDLGTYHNNLLGALLPLSIVARANMMLVDTPHFYIPVAGIQEVYRHLVQIYRIDKLRISLRTYYGSILSGALERSNVDLSEEMVGLITAQRNFQANAKAIDTATQISQTIINLRT